MTEAENTLKNNTTVRDGTVGASWFLRKINEYKCAWSNVLLSRIATRKQQSVGKHKTNNMEIEIIKK